MTTELIISPQQAAAIGKLREEMYGPPGITLTLSAWYGQTPGFERQSDAIVDATITTAESEILGQYRLFPGGRVDHAFRDRAQAAIGVRSHD